MMINRDDIDWYLRAHQEPIINHWREASFFVDHDYIPTL